jgi:hypothetical protein
LISASESRMPSQESLLPSYGQIIGHLEIIGNIVHDRYKSCCSELMFANDQYAKLLADTIQAMKDRRDDLKMKRDQLAIDLADMENALSLANEDIESATTIWGRSPFGAQAIGETKPLVGVGMTDAVEYVLKTLGAKLIPTEVRNKMEEWGYDFSKYETDEVSSIHTTLKRLESRGKVRGFDEGHRRRAYQWIGNKTLAGTDSGVGN